MDSMLGLFLAMIAGFVKDLNPYEPPAFLPRRRISTSQKSSSRFR